MKTAFKTALLLLAITFTTTQLSAQCDNMRAYKGMTATLAKGQAAGQSFLVTDDCKTGKHLSAIQINHQSQWETNVTLKIYKGQSTKPANLMYTQENVIIPDATKSGNKHTIKLGSGTGKLLVESCHMYTFTIQPTNNNFRWNGEYNDKAQPGIALWPNNGGMFVPNGYDYLYKLTYANMADTGNQ